jgi:hypothetical protein
MVRCSRFDINKSETPPLLSIINIGAAGINPVKRNVPKIATILHTNGITSKKFILINIAMPKVGINRG